MFRWVFANSLGLVSARLVSVGLVSAGQVSVGLVSTGLVSIGLVSVGLVSAVLVSIGLVSAGLVPWPLHHQQDKSQKSFSLFSPDLRSDFKPG